MAAKKRKVDPKAFRTSILFDLEQANALKMEALRLQTERVRAGLPAGKADMSEVVRGIVAEWLKGRR